MGRSQQPGHGAQRNRIQAHCTLSASADQPVRRGLAGDVAAGGGELSACRESSAEKSIGTKAAIDRELHAQADDLFKEPCRAVRAAVRRTVKEAGEIAPIKLRQEIPCNENESFTPICPGKGNGGELRGDARMLSTAYRFTIACAA